MGIYVPILGKLQDKIKGNKLIKPDILKPVDDEKSQLTDLKDLLDEVSDDQKEIVEKEIINVNRGLNGERRIEFELKNSDLPIIVLHDINLDYDERCSQIDFVVITTKCIFSIESKNLYGEVKINKDDFIRILRSKDNYTYKQERIYSPVSQNEKHISLLKHFLKDKLKINNMPIYSLVVFSDASTIVNTQYASKEVKDVVINHDNLKKRMKELIDSSSYDINVTGCYEIANTLLENDEGYKSYYVNNLKLKLGVKDEPENNNSNENNKDNELYDKLKNWRYEKAKELNVKPYYIFNNEVLSDLILKLPKNIDELFKINGFGIVKVNKYGYDIMKIINGESYINEFDYNTNLFLELYEWRKDRAYRFDIDEDYICTDEVLINVCRFKPISKDDLIKTTGFDEKKYKYNGEEMLAIIKKY